MDSDRSQFHLKIEKRRLQKWGEKRGDSKNHQKKHTEFLVHLKTKIIANFVRFYLKCIRYPCKNNIEFSAEIMLDLDVRNDVINIEISINLTENLDT